MSQELLSYKPSKRDLESIAMREIRRRQRISETMRQKWARAKADGTADAWCENMRGERGPRTKSNETTEEEENA